MTRTLPARPDRPHLRVATLNVLHDTDTWDLRLPAIAAAIALADADVVCLQEVLAADALGSDRGAAQRIADLAGYDYAEASIPTRSGVALLSRHPFIDCESGILPYSTLEHDQSHITGTFEAAGRIWQVTSVHLAWAGVREPDRWRQATYLIDRLELLSERHGAIAVLAGDFNSFPESQTNRYLRGLELSAWGGGTYWQDAWKETHDRSVCRSVPCASSSCGATVAADNPWAEATASRHGIAAEDLTSRRIDYIYSNVWQGKAGSPLAACRFGTEAGPYGVFPSDHYGVVADLLA